MFVRDYGGSGAGGRVGSEERRGPGDRCGSASSHVGASPQSGLAMSRRAFLALAGVGALGAAGALAGCASPFGSKALASQASGTAASTDELKVVRIGFPGETGKVGFE